MPIRPIFDDTALSMHRRHLENMLTLRDKVLSQDVPLKRSDQAQTQTKLAAYNSTIEELNRAIREYLNLKNGLIRTFPLPNLKDIGVVLVQARIARGWSQTDLADSLGTTPQDIAKAETDFYRRATLNERQLVAQALRLHIKGRQAVLARVPHRTA